jgi:hypothetical protein
MKFATSGKVMVRVGMLPVNDGEIPCLFIDLRTARRGFSPVEMPAILPSGSGRPAISRASVCCWMGTQIGAEERCC